MLKVNIMYLDINPYGEIYTVNNINKTEIGRKQCKH
jgi:hypothetical protein